MNTNLTLGPGLNVALLYLRVGARSWYFSSVVGTWETDVIRMATAPSPPLAREFPRGIAG